MIGWGASHTSFEVDTIISNEEACENYCQSCRVEEGQALSICDFDIEMEPDTESKCNCCDSCRYNCANEV